MARAPGPPWGRLVLPGPDSMQSIRAQDRMQVRDVRNRAGTPRGITQDPQPEEEEEESGPPGTLRCPRHLQPLDVYCRTDKEVICERCASSTKHRGHRTGPATEELSRKRVELGRLRSTFNQILQEQGDKKEEFQRVLDQIQEEARGAEDSCETSVVSVIDSLQRGFVSVKRLIRAEEEAAGSRVRDLMEARQAKLDQMMQRNQELEGLAQTQSLVHFLKKWACLRPLCQQDLQHSFPEVSPDVPASFQSTQQAVHHLANQLQGTCDQHFTTITQRGDTTVNRTQTAPALVPITRQQLLQYACEISLDPETAHDELVISNGNKKVNRSAQKFPKAAFCPPEKFMRRYQVLCREPLVAERCYYEVEVKNDKAEIALAYFGIDRKSLQKRSAFGANDKSWSLDRSAFYSVTHNDVGVQLTLQPSHPRIGVYLQHREGALSFYEVENVEEGTMKFLYKVSAQFTEPLYPGFWLGDKCCITICDLSGSRP